MYEALVYEMLDFLKVYYEEIGFKGKETVNMAMAKMEELTDSATRRIEGGSEVDEDWAKYDDIGINVE